MILFRIRNKNIHKLYKKLLTAKYCVYIIKITSCDIVTYIYERGGDEMRQKRGKALKHLPYLELKAALARKGLNQKYIASLLGLSPVTVNQKINGSLDFSYREAEIIANNLEAKTHELFFTKKVAGM